MGKLKLIIKILHIVPSVSAGGIESFVVSLMEKVNCDKFHFDFAVLNPNNPIHKKKINKFGSRVFFIAKAGVSTSLYSKISWRIHAVLNFWKLLSLFEYDVIHCHLSTTFGPYIFISWIKGVPIRIVHSHNTSEKKNSIYHEVIRKIINFLNFDFLISHKIGCSDMATTWLFGKQSIKNYRAKTIYNGIDLEKFVINRKNKELERKQNNLNEGIHFIHIGRFHIQKNQKFLIDLFYEMLKIRKDIYLNIVGFGNLEATLKNYVNKLKLENHIFFYKYDTDIPSILRMMDYFLLPSLCEGLPITAIEAQVSNIPIFISESVTKEVDMGLAMFIPLSIGHKFWAQIILNSTNNYWINRCVDLKKLKLFDIKNVIKQFEAIYVISLHRRNLRM